MSTSPTRIGYFEVAPQINEQRFTEIVASARFLCGEADCVFVWTNRSPVYRFAILFRNVHADDLDRTEDLFNNIVGRIADVPEHKRAPARHPQLLNRHGSVQASWKSRASWNIRPL